MANQIGNQSTFKIYSLWAIVLLTWPENSRKMKLRHHKLLNNFLNSAGMIVTIT